MANVNRDGAQYGIITTQRKPLDPLTALQVRKYRDKIRTKIGRLNDRLFCLKGKRHMLNKSIQACKEANDARLIFGIRDATTHEILRVKRLIAERNLQLQ